MLLVGNGRVITRSEKQPFIVDGAVVIDGKEILDVGSSSLREKYPDAEFIDAHGGVIMPAFINAHEHIYSALARGLSINGYNPKSFLEILDEKNGSKKLPLLRNFRQGRRRENESRCERKRRLCPPCHE